VFDGTLVKLIKFPAEHLTIFHGTLVFRGTPIENHCCRKLKLNQFCHRFQTITFRYNENPHLATSLEKWRCRVSAWGRMLFRILT